MKTTARKIVITIMSLVIITAFLVSASASAMQMEQGKFYDLKLADMPAGFELYNIPSPADLVPGMYIVGSESGIFLEGTPTAVGHYAGGCTVVLKRFEGMGYEEVDVAWDVEVREKPAPQPEYPTVTKQPTGESVTEGGSAIFITYGTGYVEMQWSLLTPTGATINVYDAHAYYPGLVVNNADPTRLILSNIPLGMNGCRIYTELRGSGNTYARTDGNCVLTVNRAGLSITKNPTSESVDEGGHAEFVTYGTGYIGMNWYLVSPAGEYIPANNAGYYFPGLGVNNTTATRLVLRNIPAELNGYRVVTILNDAYGKEMKTTDNCILTVRIKTPPAPVQEEVSIGEHADTARANTIPDVMTSSDGKYEIAFITDMGELKDNSFNQASYDGVKLYADAHGISYKFYLPAEGSQATDEDIYLMMKTAVSKGAGVIVCAGTSHSTALPRAAAEFPDVKFIYIDGEGIGDRSNVAGITFKEEQSGYLAGYAAVKEGFRKLGFMGGGGGKYPAVCRFGYGFAQGANAAAAELGVNVTLKYSWMYGSAFSASEKLRSQANYWYESGTEVIFVAGGSMFSSVSAAAAQNKGAKIIGVDVDQSFGSDAVITSALKDVATAAGWALEKAYDGAWNEIGGKTTSIGAAVGATGLPTETWSMENFTVDAYNALLQNIVSGRVHISSTVLETLAISNERFSNLRIEYIA